VPYNAFADNTSIFICLADVASQICEIPSCYNCMLQFHGIFLLDSNFGHTSFRFRDIGVFSSKTACFLHPTLVWRPLAEERPTISTLTRYTAKKYINGLYNIVADNTDLSSFVYLLLPAKSAKFSVNSNLYSSRSSKIIDLGVNRKRIMQLPIRPSH